MRNLAIKTVISAAIRAFNLTVGLNRQEHARMAVPCFMIRAGAMQRQILRLDDYNVFFQIVYSWFGSSLCFLIFRYCKAKRPLGSD